MIEYSISDDNLHLVDSYLISKWHFREVLVGIHKEKPEYNVWQRTYSQMCLEWACHSFLYNVHIARSRVKDCDLNTGQPFWLRAAYAIGGCAVWIFI